MPVVAGRWYVAWARVSGCSSDCGSSGQSTVTTEDQVHVSYCLNYNVKGEGGITKYSSNRLGKIKFAPLGLHRFW